MIYKRDSIDGSIGAVLETIASVCGKFGKAYCYAGQKKILELLEKYHGIKICRRTLNTILRWLEDHGFFDRTKRHRAGPNGGIIFCTTMFTLKKKAFTWLNSMKKWVDRLFLPLRVQDRAQYRSQRKNEIFKHVARNVEKVWNSPIEGRASPV